MFLLRTLRGVLMHNLLRFFLKITFKAVKLTIQSLSFVFKILNIAFSFFKFIHILEFHVFMLLKFRSTFGFFQFIFKLLQLKFKFFTLMLKFIDLIFNSRRSSFIKIRTIKCLMYLVKFISFKRMMLIFMVL